MHLIKTKFYFILFNFHDANYDSDEVATNPRLSRHSRCTSHTLSLVAITDVVKAINSCCICAPNHKRVMIKCQELWKCLNSPKNREQLAIQLSCCLQRPLPTRWNLIYAALKQICSLWEQLSGNEVRKIV